MRIDSGPFDRRIWIRSALVILWSVVLFAQIVMYTSLAEIVSYGLLDMVVVVAFLRYVHLIRSSYSLFAIIFVTSFVLGLVPYKIRMHDFALFFFESAKDEGVTYYIDPYMNLRAMVWDLVFPAAHFIAMYAISMTYRKSSHQNPI